MEISLIYIIEIIDDEYPNVSTLTRIKSQILSPSQHEMHAETAQSPLKRQCEFHRT
jgi:hypothetical protein